MEEIRDAHCTKCLLHTNCKTVCIGGRGYKGGLMIIAESPSAYDDDNDTVLGSSQDSIIEKIIFDVLDGNRDKIYKTHLGKCHSKGKFTDDSVAACREYLEAEIRYAEPKVVIALGDFVYKSLADKEVKGSSRGKLGSLTIGKGANKIVTSLIGTHTPYAVSKNNAKLEELAIDLGRAYSLATGAAVNTGGTKIVVCDTMDKVELAVEYCKQVGICSFDFETPEIDENKGTFLEGFVATSLSLSFQAGSSYVIPLEHFESPYTKQEAEYIVSYVGKELFSNKSVRKIGHNLSYDMHIARIYGADDFRGRLDDTMLMHHLFDETKRHGLKELVYEYFPEYMGYEDGIKDYKWNEVPYSLLGPYNGIDTDLTLRLSTLLESYLLEDPRVYTIYRNLSMAALKPLWNAEKRGMLIDDCFLADAIKIAKELIVAQELKLKQNKVFKRYDAYKEEEAKYAAIDNLRVELAKYATAREEKVAKLLESMEGATEKKILSIEKAILAAKEKSISEAKLDKQLTDLKLGILSAYEGFNFGSPKQLEDLLYDCEEGFRFRTLVRGTGKDVISELDDSTGFIDDLLLLRSLEKMCSTYLEGLWSRMDKHKRVHTQLLIHGTVSGRLSSRNPNLQNLPNIAKLKSEIAVRVVSMVKKCFIAPKGYRIMQWDFSQAELRIIASFAKEPTMLKAFNDNVDLHALTGSTMLKVTLDDFYQLAKEVQKEARTRAKAGNFGLIYGMGYKGFMNYAKSNYNVVLNEEASMEIISDFFNLYPELLTYHAVQIAKANKFGWVRTLYGRRRRTPDIDNKSEFRRGEEERVAINSPVQGTAGEFTIFAISLLEHRLDPRVMFEITVHDSIMFYVPEDLVDATHKLVKDCCENLPNMQYFGKELEGVKMKVDLETSSTSWKELSPYPVDKN